MPDEPYLLNNAQRVSRRQIGHHLLKGAAEITQIVDRVGETRSDLVTPDEHKHLEAARKALVAAGKRYEVLGKTLTTTQPEETVASLEQEGPDAEL